MSTAQLGNKTFFNFEFLGVFFIFQAFVFYKYVLECNQAIGVFHVTMHVDLVHACHSRPLHDHGWPTAGHCMAMAGPQQATASRGTAKARPWSTGAVACM
jgi:hypothetical protein